MTPDDRLGSVTRLTPRRRRSRAVNALSAYAAFAVVACGVAGSLLAVALGAFRPGALGLGISVALAAVLRGVLPEANAAWLTVRTRAVDVAILAVLGGGLIIFAAIVPAPA